MLIVLSCPETYANEMSIVNSLFEQGLEVFHLRKPDFSYNALQLYIKSIPEQFRSRMILHSHYGLAREYNLGGIHITGKARNGIQDWKSINLQKSISLHSIEELLECSGEFVYAFLSPVFDSISKKAYKSKFKPEKLNNVLRSGTINTKVIALGGVKGENLPLLLSNGFSGVAMLGAIWGNPDDRSSKNDPVKKFIDIKKIYSSCNATAIS